MNSPDEWTLTIPGTPWSKQRPRISKAVAGKSRRTHQPAADRNAEKQTRDYLQENWPHDPLTGNVWLTARFWRPTRQVVDLDNLVKHLQDAATGVLWVNDAQVTAITAALDLDRDNPRTEFWIEEHVTGLTRDYGPK